jgi:hypothetical protein
VKNTPIALLLIVAVLCGVASESALARSGRSGGGHSGGRHSAGSGFSGHHFVAPRARIGGFVAAPLFFYAPATAYYNSPFFAAPSEPPVYIEQGAAPGAEAPAAGNWYYCAGAQAYYPYVKECPEGWQTVAPIPPVPSL